MIKGKIEVFKNFGTPEQELVQTGDNLVVDGFGEVVADILTLSPSLSANTDSSSILDTSNFTVQALSFGKAADAYKENAHKPGEMHPYENNDFERRRVTNRENLLKSDDFTGDGWSKNEDIDIYPDPQKDGELVEGPIPGSKVYLINNNIRGNHYVRYYSQPIEDITAPEDQMDAWSNTIHDTSSQYVCWSCFFKINPSDRPEVNTYDSSYRSTDMKIGMNGDYLEKATSAFNIQMHTYLRWDASSIEEASSMAGGGWGNYYLRDPATGQHIGDALRINSNWDVNLYTEKYDNGWYRQVLSMPIPPTPSGIATIIYPTGYANDGEKMRGSIYASCPQLEIGRFASEWEPARQSDNLHPYPTEVSSWTHNGGNNLESNLDEAVAPNPYGGSGVDQYYQTERYSWVSHLIPYGTLEVDEYYTFSLFVSGVNGTGEGGTENKCTLQIMVNGLNSEGMPGWELLRTYNYLNLVDGTLSISRHPSSFSHTIGVEEFTNGWYRIHGTIKIAERGPNHPNNNDEWIDYGEVPRQMRFGIRPDGNGSTNVDAEDNYIEGDYSYLNIWGAKVEKGTEATDYVKEFNNFDFSGTIRDGITKVIPSGIAETGVISEDQTGVAPTPNDTTLSITSESDIEEDLGLDIQGGQLPNLVPFRDRDSVHNSSRMNHFPVYNRKRDYVPFKSEVSLDKYQQHPLDNYAYLMGCFPDGSGTSTPTTVHFVSSLDSSAAMGSPDQVYTFSSLFNTVSSMDFRGFLRAYHMGDETDPASGLIVSSLSNLSSTGKVKYKMIFASGDRGYSTMFGGVHDLGLWVPDFRKAHDSGYTPPFSFHPVDNEFDYKLIAHKNLTTNLGHTAEGVAIDGDSFEDLTIIWTLSFLEQ